MRFPKESDESTFSCYKATKNGRMALPVSFLVPGPQPRRSWRKRRNLLSLQGCSGGLPPAAPPGAALLGGGGGGKRLSLSLAPQSHESSAPLHPLLGPILSSRRFSSEQRRRHHFRFGWYVLSDLHRHSQLNHPPFRIVVGLFRSISDSYRMSKNSS